MAVDPPRYAPGLPLPGRPFKPGTGQSRPALPSFAPPCRGHPKAESDEAAGLPFRYGVDLFNGGYWWEAHEIWEDLWRRSPRGTARNHLLKGLIMLAAALLKGSSGMPRGRRRLLGRGLEYLRRAAAGEADPNPLSVPLADLIARYQAWQQQAEQLQSHAALLAGMPRLWLHTDEDSRPHGSPGG